jgi:hypothetical protein
MHGTYEERANEEANERAGSHIDQSVHVVPHSCETDEEGEKKDQELEKGSNWLLHLATLLKVEDGVDSESG